MQGAALRGSLLLGVSAFDFLVHEIVRVECVRNIRAKKPLDLMMPGSIMLLNESDAERAFDLFMRSKNSTKAFASSKNIKDAFSPVCKNIWNDLEVVTGLDKDLVCKEIDNIWRWRNRIAHEGDFIPSSLSFVNWPIWEIDVRDKVSYLSDVGIALIRTARARVV